MPPLYADVEDLEAHVEGTAYEGRLPDDVERLLELAERDIDQQAFKALPRRDGAPKLDLGLLDRERRQGLAAAVCAQAVYRVEMGDEHFVRTRVPSRPGNPTHPILGPEAQRELDAAGLWALTTSSLSGHGDDPETWQRR